MDTPGVINVVDKAVQYWIWLKINYPKLYDSVCQLYKIIKGVLIVFISLLISYYMGDIFASYVGKMPPPPPEIENPQLLFILLKINIGIVVNVLFMGLYYILKIIFHNKKDYY